MAANSVTFNSTANTSWVVPNNLTGGTVRVQAWGAGGGGGSNNRTGNNAGGGGGGGAYTENNSTPVTKGANLTIVIGAGGANATSNRAAGGAGGYTSFNNNQVLARGGGGGAAAGTGGVAGNGANSTPAGRNGGAGAAKVATGIGGGGGSSAGTGANGRAGQGQVGGGNGTDSGNLPTGAGAGANGGAAGANGTDAGTLPGGGGGGTGNGSKGTPPTGKGANGQIILTWDENDPPTVALNTPADAGNVNTSTPVLTFTGTDADSDTIRYNVQIHTDNNFTNTKTFGYTTLGSSILGPGQNKLYGTRFTSPADAGTVTAVKHAICSDLGTGRYFKVVIVKQSDGTIVTNGVSNAAEMPYSAAAEPSWVTLSFSTAPVLSPSTDYILYVIHGDSDNSNYSAYDAGTDNYYYFDSSNSYATPTNPTDAVTTGDDNGGPNNAKLSIYVEYTPTIVVNAVSGTDAGFSGVNQVGIDATSNSGVKSATSSFSWNHTVTTGSSNRMLVVCLQYRENTDTNIGASGVTYNSVAMTLMHSKQDYSANASAYLRSEIWGLYNPSTGTNSIAVTCNGANDHATGEAISLTNARQTTTENANGDGFEPTNDVSDPSITVTTTVNSCLVIDSVYSLTSYDNLSIGASQTVISSKMAPNSSGDESASSYEFKVTAGATTMSWTTPGAGAGMDGWVSAGVAIEPAQDLFDSAQSATYTVQSALSETTYYWRVRGIDPSGSNTYGSWATTRSFTVSADRVPRMGFTNHMNPGMV